MKERLKEVRKTLGMTQQKFADSLGVKQNTIAQYEMGRNQPIDSVITLICREFNVSEEWLRTGNGQMFNELSREELVAKFVGEALASADPFVINTFIALGKLKPEDWAVVKKFIDTLKELEQDEEE